MRKINLSLKKIISINFYLLLFLSTHLYANPVATNSFVITGEKNLLTWDPTFAVSIEETFNDQIVRSFSPSPSIGEVDITRGVPGKYTYNIVSCHSISCMTQTVAVHVGERPCLSLDDLYNYTDFGGCAIHATKEYKGFGGVDVKIFPANEGKRYTNRLFYVAGPYQFGEQIDMESYFQLIRENLAEDEKVDIAYFSFNRFNSDYLQNKAFALDEAIKTIDRFRGGAEPSAILGVSLGGVVSRYTLRTMEIEGYEHKIEYYMSLDAPHLGAHIPISLQKIPKFLSNSMNAALKDNRSPFDKFLIGLSDIFGSGASGALSDLEKSKNLTALVYEGTVNQVAAQQLLIQHNEAGSQRHPLGLSLQQELKDLGMPINSKNIGFSLGNGSGNRLDFLGKDTYIDLDTKEKSDNRLWLRPSITLPKNNQVFYGHLRYKDITNISHGKDSYVENYKYNGPKLDGISCSTIPLPLELSQEIEAQIMGFWPNYSLNLNTEKSCFIPTLSALAIDNLPLDATFDSAYLAENNPFDEIYVADQNSPHDLTSTLDETEGFFINMVMPILKDAIINTYAPKPKHQISPNVNPDPIIEEPAIKCRTVNVTSSPNCRPSLPATALSICLFNQPKEKICD